MVPACDGVKEPERADFGCEILVFGLYSVSDM
jgi:hypothetical protein